MNKPKLDISNSSINLFMFVYILTNKRYVVFSYRFVDKQVNYIGFGNFKTWL